MEGEILMEKDEPKYVFKIPELKEEGFQFSTPYQRLKKNRYDKPVIWPVLGIVLTAANNNGEYFKYNVKWFINVIFLDKNKRELSPQPRNYMANSSFEVDLHSKRKSVTFPAWVQLGNGDNLNDHEFQYFKIKYKVLEIRENAVDRRVIYKAPDASMDCVKFQEFYQNEEMSDFSIIAGGKKFPVHKIILASRSPVFRAMFSHQDSKECQENCIVIEDIDDVSIGHMLEFMYSYTKKFVFDDKKSYDYSTLMKAADKYDIEGLKNFLIEKLQGGLNIKNVLDYLVLSHIYHIPSMKNACFKIMEKNKELFSHSDMLSINKSHPELLIEYLRQTPGY